MLFICVPDDEFAAAAPMAFQGSKLPEHPKSIVQQVLSIRDSVGPLLAPPPQTSGRLKIFFRYCAACHRDHRLLKHRQVKVQSV